LSRIFSVGYLALPTMISWPMIVVATACRNDSTSNSPAFGLPSAPTNLRRFSDARLHAESSRYMYSLHGFDALMRAVPDEVCQALTVVSYCRPGSPHSHAAVAMSRQRSRAWTVWTGLPSRGERSTHSRSFCTASMKSSVTRTELLEFWKKTDLYASPSNEPS
jgi:hypothetical protein